MILSKLNKNLGVKLFNNPNSLNYNLFNLFFKKNIANFNDDQIKQYHELGFLKPNLDSYELAKYLSDEINKSDAKKIEKLSNEHTKSFEINDEMKKKIKFHLENNFKNIIQNFKNYYQSDIAVVNVRLRRNFGLKETNYYDSQKRTKQFEFYNNYFHCDYYTMNYFKLFINLQDISPEDGPLTFYSIEDTKKFVRESKFKSRNDYKNINIDRQMKNCGKIGESLFLNTPQCVHKASIPKFGNCRDVLFITFIAVPEKINNIFYFEKDYQEDIWGSGKDLVKRFSKPNNFRKTYRLYKSFRENLKNNKYK